MNLSNMAGVVDKSDGLVQTVKVKTKDSVYVSLIQKLCLLENDLECM